MKSALLFRLGGLGDLLVALPSLHLLRRAFPRAILHLVGRPGYGRLLREAGVIDAVLSAEDAAWTPLFDDGRSLPEDLRGRLASYELVLGWFHGESGPPAFFSELKSASPEYRVFGYDVSSRVPISRYFFDRTREFVQERGAPVVPYETCCHLPLSKEEAAKGRSSREVFPAEVVIHPGSGSPKKCWPLERFMAVMNVLHEGGLSGALVTGEAEERMEADLQRIPFPPNWRWFRRPALLDLAVLLHSASCYIGNDSGVTHLAAACGAQVIAIFRKDLETAWSPAGRTVVLSADDVERIPLLDVLAVLARRLPRPHLFI